MVVLAFVVVVAVIGSFFFGRCCRGWSFVAVALAFIAAAAILVSSVLLLLCFCLIAVAKSYVN